MPRIDEMPEYRANLKKHVHDLSHKLGFTATVGHLLPVFHDFANPGETYELGFNYNLRTQPLQSAAMVDIKSHVEYFFVPIQLLYEPFGNMFYNINDYYSSFIAELPTGGPIQNALPVWNWSLILGYLNSDYNSTIGGYEAWYNHAYRLLDLLGFNPCGLMTAETTTSNNHNPNVFPYSILAYNCIYQYYYRLDNRQRFTNDFNWDSYYSTPYVSGNAAYWKRVLRLFYRPKDSDYFTDIKVSPIVDVLNTNVKSSLEMAQNWLSREMFKNAGGSDVAVLGLGSVGSPSNIYGEDGAVISNPSSSIITKFGFNASDAIIANTYNSNVYVKANGNDINTANIRALFASEKLWSITGRARKHYDDQTLAHFGFKVPHDIKHEISCFGHDRGLIHIGEVISTASTTQAPLGEIAGKGYGSLSSGNHKFTAPCHGVIMAICSFVPDITYSDTFLKANVLTGKDDLYQPEYDSLGMQPLFGYETQPEAPTTWQNIIGWQYRYEQWKRRYNRVSQAFRFNAGNLDSWMLDFRPSSVPNSANTDNFVTYVHDPSELNQIMMVNYVSTPPGSGDPDSIVYDGDPFVVDGFIHCKKVSTMSDYSLPRLDA